LKYNKYIINCCIEGGGDLTVFPCSSIHGPRSCNGTIL
jgi:hypothetical protein